jgi:CelD/BcsL family acetyltransferase involved in cellulose biosynthesis
MLAPVPLSAEVLALDADHVAEIESEWRALERRSLTLPYLGWDWLAAWVLVYQPKQLAIARVRDEEGQAVALGLIERHRLGRWRFVGAPVTPARGLLCDPSLAEAAWAALTRQLSAQRTGCSILEGEGLPQAVAPVLAGAIRPGPAVYALDLPRSFDEYLSQRKPSARKGLKQKLRRLGRVNGSVTQVEDSNRQPALLDFVDLHRARARAKGLHHPGIDERLAALLAAVGNSPVVTLRLFELVVDGVRAGVTVRIDCGSTAYFYNAGIDPSHGWLGPGLLLELGSIADAIERGLARFDLGPGAYRYKTELGGVESARYDLCWTRPSLEARLLRAAAGTSVTERGRARARALLYRVWSRRAAGGSPPVSGPEGPIRRLPS